jgi:hypothetical protein
MQQATNLSRSFVFFFGFLLTPLRELLPDPGHSLVARGRFRVLLLRRSRCGSGSGIGSGSGRGSSSGLGLRGAPLLFGLFARTLLRCLLRAPLLHERFQIGIRQVPRLLNTRQQIRSGQVLR